jgi:hypothetical protein
MCDDTSDFIEEAVRSVFTDICSVADPGLFIPDPESEFFHRGSWVKEIPDPGSAIRIKEIKYF